MQRLIIVCHNNIMKIQTIDIPDILAIKFYTDLDDAQYSFRTSFRKEDEKETSFKGKKLKSFLEKPSW